MTKVESIPIGRRVRINFWTDRRQEGFQYGTVIGKPINCFGIIAQFVSWDNGYKSLIPVVLFELVD